MNRDLTPSTSEDGPYRSIFEAASDGLVIYDIGLDCIVEANPAACRMHGYTREEFIGLNPAVLMSAENHAQFKEQAQTAKAGSAFEAFLLHLRRDGSAFHVEVRRSMILYRDTPCLLSIIRDVSQRIQTEKNLDARIHPPGIHRVKPYRLYAY